MKTACVKQQSRTYKDVWGKPYFNLSEHSLIKPSRFQEKFPEWFFQKETIELIETQERLYNPYYNQTSYRHILDEQTKQTQNTMNKAIACISASSILCLVTDPENSDSLYATKPILNAFSLWLLRNR